MKNRSFKKWVILPTAIASLIQPAAIWATEPDTNVVTETTTQYIRETPEPKGRVHLSANAEEVLKLSRAKVSDGTVVAFIMNSGSSYHLTASEILYLRDEGVSDFVITTMLDQGRKLTAAHHSRVAKSDSTDSGDSTVAMAFTNAVTAPLVPNAETIYSVPQSVPGYYYDDSYGYYPNYSYYWGPGWSIGFGLGPIGGPPGHGPHGGPPPGRGPAGGVPGGGHPGGPPGGMHGGGIPGGGGPHGGGAPGGGPHGGGPGGGGPGGPGGGGGGGGRR